MTSFPSKFYQKIWK